MELKPPSSGPGPFAQYLSSQLRSSPCWFDEYLGDQGQPRSVWQPIVDYLDRLGPQGIEACAVEASRLVRESGANFRVTGEQEARPWQLAIVPLVLDQKAWSELESGLQQRVRVLEAVLSDLLGGQRLLKDRVLPAELLSANPEFSRVYYNLPTSGLRLGLTATDLARNSDGAWWVVGDRTRAPSGLGFALENRLITSRVLPQLIRRTNVTRLASFFAAFQEHLSSLAPRMRENPRVAILTPGKGSYRYVEDAHLARYLGYTLVQGRDLAVRNNRLNLKTLGGLLPIEVLWRNVTDSACDPLELDPGSDRGVTGLLQTIRSGSVAVTNCIGSALVQMPALLPFLPAACQYLFGEELKLPSIPTYWCGGDAERRHVEQNLEQFVIRPAFVISGEPPLVPAEMSSVEREALVARIRRNPFQFVAQPRPSRSTAPVWHRGQLKSWHVALRTFHLQTGQSVKVMPGGLVRVSPEARLLDHSPTSGRLGQDCWLVADEPVDHDRTLLPTQGVAIRLTRSGAELPSRVAENLFWLGRYAERAESIARVLRNTLVHIAGEKLITDIPNLPRMIAALAAMGHIEPDYAIKELGDAMPTLETVLPDSVFDRDQPRGLQACVIHLADKATEVRDRISLDAYRIITRISDTLSDRDPVANNDAGAMIDRINQLLADLTALSGVAMESMTRTHGWRFLQLGRRIERAYQTAELLAATLVHPITDERPLLESVLQATDSLMTYRSRYLLQLNSIAAIDLLVTDDTNPRSILFQLQTIDGLITRLPTDSSEFGLGADQKIAEQLLHRVRMSEAGALSSCEAGMRSELQSLLDLLIEELPKLSDAIAARYLIHTATTQELTGRLDVPHPSSLHT